MSKYLYTVESTDDGDTLGAFFTRDEAITFIEEYNTRKEYEACYLADGIVLNPVVEELLY